MWNVVYFFLTLLILALPRAYCIGLVFLYNIVLPLFSSSHFLTFIQPVFLTCATIFLNYQLFWQAHGPKYFYPKTISIQLKFKGSSINDASVKWGTRKYNLCLLCFLKKKYVTNAVTINRHTFNQCNTFECCYIIFHENVSFI